MYITPEKLTANVILPVPGWWVCGELARKIRTHYPHFDFVVDGEGNLCDVIPKEAPHE